MALKKTEGVVYIFFLILFLLEYIITTKVELEIGSGAALKAGVSGGGFLSICKWRVQAP